MATKFSPPIVVEPAPHGAGSARDEPAKPGEAARPGEAPLVPPPVNPNPAGSDSGHEGSTGEVVPPPAPPPAEAPEEEHGKSIITFMGRKLAGGGIVWVIDQSASISNMQLMLRNELAISLKQLTPRHKFNIVTFHERAVFFEDELVEGTETNTNRRYMLLDQFIGLELQKPSPK